MRRRMKTWKMKMRMMMQSSASLHSPIAGGIRRPPPLPRLRQSRSGTGIRTPDPRGRTGPAIVAPSRVERGTRGRRLRWEALRGRRTAGGRPRPRRGESFAPARASTPQWRAESPGRCCRRRLPQRALWPPTLGWLGGGCTSSSAPSTGTTSEAERCECGQTSQRHPRSGSSPTATPKAARHPATRTAADPTRPSSQVPHHLEHRRAHRASDSRLVPDPIRLHRSCSRSRSRSRHCHWPLRLHSRRPTP